MPVGVDARAADFLEAPIFIYIYINIYIYIDRQSSRSFSADYHLQHIHTVANLVTVLSSTSQHP